MHVGGGWGEDVRWGMFWDGLPGARSEHYGRNDELIYRKHISLTITVVSEYLALRSHEFPIVLLYCG